MASLICCHQHVELPAPFVWGCCIDRKVGDFKKLPANDRSIWSSMKLCTAQTSHDLLENEDINRSPFNSEDERLLASIAHVPKTVATKNR